MKENILVIFGGKSAEHDISIITGLQTISNVDRDKFNVIPLYISKNNNFYIGEKLCYLSTFMPFNSKTKGVFGAALIPGSQFLFGHSKNNIYFNGETGKQILSSNKEEFDAPTKRKLKKIVKIDCAIVCCHGKSGEDGCLQGLLELCGIPYSSSNVCSSSICMDKIFMKKLFAMGGFNTADFVSFNKIEYILNQQEVLGKIENLKYPVFVKPANLGSSIGISKCCSKEELEEAIEIATNFDSRILVEKSIENNIEINQAVFGDSSKILTSQIEIPMHKNSFLTFDEKYIQRQDSATEKQKQNVSIDDEIKNEIEAVSTRLFKQLNCKGVVRIDYLYDKNQKQLYVNEINSIPGSLAFYLFKDKFDYKTLLTQLISIAKKEFLEEQKLNLNFKSSALSHFNSGIKSNKYSNNV